MGVYCTHRAKIEENYGRELTKLARQYHAKDEIGYEREKKNRKHLFARIERIFSTLKATWEELKTGKSQGKGTRQAKSNTRIVRVAV